MAYNSSSIDTLRFPESVRKSAAMYLGSTDEHGRWLIARELLDNGLDEHLAGRNRGVILVECKDGSYWAIDLGAGIPQGFKTFDVNVNGNVIKNKMPTMQAIFSELHTSGKFRSEAYKVSVGCFTADTKVRLLNGEIITFENLYKRWCNDQTPIEIMTWDTKKDRVAYSTISHVQLSKYTKHLVEVNIDGNLVRCTPDHPFFVRTEDGIKKVQAKDLQIGDSLVSMDLQKDKDGIKIKDINTFIDSYNHQVCGVRRIKLRKEVPVYGMTVDNFHTYFIEPGVLVSNTHGIGAKGTNATSDFFDVYTKFEGQWYSIKFEKGVLTQPVKKIKTPKGPTGKPLKRGTAIHFKPDATIFSGKSNIDLKFAHQWAEITSYLNPGFTVMILDKNGKSKKYISQNGPVEYVDKILTDLKANAEESKFVFHNDLCDAVVAFSNAEGLNVRGYTNGLFNSQGGKHVDSICNAIVNTLKTYAKKKQTISAYDVKEGLVGIVNMKLHKAEFSSQDKSRLTDLRAGKDFEELMTKEFDTFFKKNKALALRLCEKASKLSELRSQFKASKKVVQALNAVKRKGMPAKYSPYDSKTKVEDRELLIVEGESASGGLREKRKPWQALCPLRGKITNAMKTGDKILESEEVVMILGALGFDPKAEDPMKKLQISKVICLADPDPDGPVTGDTLVVTNEGLLPITEVTNRYRKGIDYNAVNHLQVLAYDEKKQEPVFADINWAGITCRTNIKYTVSFAAEQVQQGYIADDPYQIECTGSHKWAVREDDGSIRYVRTDELQLGDSVVSCRLFSDKEGYIDTNTGITQKSLSVGTVCDISKRDVCIYPDTQMEAIEFYCLDVCDAHNFFVVSPSAEMNEGGEYDCDSLADNAFLCHNCHINSLLLALFYKYLPELFNEGRIFVADVPELYAQYKDKLVLGDTLSEVQSKLRDLGAPKSTAIHHIKGWGEIDASLMEVLAVNKDTRRLIQIEPLTARDATDFVSCMNDDVAFRKRMLNLP